MEGKILLVSANKWNFIDEDSKDQKSGTTLHVIHLDTSDNSDHNVGNKPKKYTLSHDSFEKFKKLDLPAVATGIFQYNFTRDKMEFIDYKNVVPLNG